MQKMEDVIECVFFLDIRMNESPRFWRIAEIQKRHIQSGVPFFVKIHF